MCRAVGDMNASSLFGVIHDPDLASPIFPHSSHQEKEEALLAGNWVELLSLSLCFYSVSAFLLSSSRVSAQGKHRCPPPGGVSGRRWCRDPAAQGLQVKATSPTTASSVMVMIQFYWPPNHVIVWQQFIHVVCMQDTKDMYISVC